MLVVKIGITIVIKQEPAAAKWAELSAHSSGFFGSVVTHLVQFSAQAFAQLKLLLHPAAHVPFLVPQHPVS